MNGPYTTEEPGRGWNRAVSDKGAASFGIASTGTSVAAVGLGYTADGVVAGCAITTDAMAQKSVKMMGKR